MLQGLSDWLWHMRFGTMSPAEITAQAAEARRMQQKAGGTLEQQEYAADEVRRFVGDYWPARGIAETLADDFSGDYLGVNDPENPVFNWTFGLVIVAALVLLLVVVGLLERR